MSTLARLNAADFAVPAAVDKIRSRSMVVGVVAGVLALIGFVTAPDAFYRAYLLGFMLCLGASLGSLGLLIIIHLTNGRWGLVIRRILEAAAKNFWFMGILFLPLAFFGVPHLYPWAKAADLAESENLRWVHGVYLNQSQYIVRGLIYFAIWCSLAYLFTKWSAEQDTQGNRSHSLSGALAGPGALLFGFTVTFGAVDWVMSLSYSWTSTIYGLIFLIGQLQSALCLATIVAVILARYEPMKSILNIDHLHDYGKWMLAFTMVWAYFSFSQWVIMWAGNLPEEIIWYRMRLHGGWQYFSLFVALFTFVFPFIRLLSAQLKKDKSSLVWTAGWLLAMRYFDVYWQIMPNFENKAGFYFHWLNLVVPVAMAGFWLALFFRNLQGQGLLPLYAPLTTSVLEPAHE
jgi:hypothetical protein